MKVSVVIPMHNEQEYIESCLESLQNQNEKADEIIVVDNNCTDRSVELAQKYNLRIVKESKPGTTHARNRGFNEAKYDILARCDADSVLPPDWISKIKKNFAKKRKIAALTGSFSFYDIPIKNTPTIKAYMIVMKKILNHYPLIGSSFALRKDVWNKVKKNTCLNDRQVHEDIDLSIHINDAKGKIGYDKSLVVKASGRRMKNDPISFFVEYPSRLVKMLRSHNKLSA